jgi:hypothetical protein
MQFLLPAALAVALMTGTAVAEEAVTPHPLPNGTTEVLYAEVLYVIAGLLVVLIVPWLRDLFVWCFTAAVGTALRLLVLFVIVIGTMGGLAVLMAALLDAGHSLAAAVLVALLGVATAAAIGRALKKRAIRLTEHAARRDLVDPGRD